MRHNFQKRIGPALKAACHREKADFLQKRLTAFLKQLPDPSRLQWKDLNPSSMQRSFKSIGQARAKRTSRIIKEPAVLGAISFFLRQPNKTQNIASRPARRASGRFDWFRKGCFHTFLSVKTEINDISVFVNRSKRASVGLGFRIAFIDSI